MSTTLLLYRVNGKNISIERSADSNVEEQIADCCIASFGPGYLTLDTATGEYRWIPQSSDTAENTTLQSGS
jgi:hypothetical protein